MAVQSKEKAKKSSEKAKAQKHKQAVAQQTPPGIPSLVLAVLIAIASFTLLLWLLDRSVPTPAHLIALLVAVVGELILAGEAIRRLIHVEGEGGLLLLKTKYGLDFLDVLARRYPAIWRALCHFGLVFGFGVVSIFLFKNISKKIYVASLLILLLFSIFILPLVLPFAQSVIFNLPSGGFSSRSGAENQLLYYAFLALIVGGGVGLFGLLGLLANGLHIVYSMVLYATGSAGALEATTAGVAPIIPGKSIPLGEGVLALIIILVVHEAAHGIMGRLYKIKLLSAGLALLGPLPIGAFVDPDEKQLRAAPTVAQRDVLVAGSTANFLTMLAFFGLLILFFNLTVPVQDNRVFISVYENATKIIDSSALAQFNGIRIEGPKEVTAALSIIQPGTEAVMETADGNSVKVGISKNGTIDALTITPTSCRSTSCHTYAYDAASGSQKTMHVMFLNAQEQAFIPLSTRLGLFFYSNTFKPGWGWLSFIYATLALTFVLNFLIGSVNLLPIPMLDGHRLFEVAVENKMIMTLITWAVIIAFLLNILPAVWKLG